MKKTKLIIGAMALALVSISVSALQAEVTYFQDAQVSTSQADKTPVKPEDLPQPVKAVLAGDSFTGWEVESAFLVSESGSEYYEVNLLKGGEKQMVNFDKEGNLLRP